MDSKLQERLIATNQEFMAIVRKCRQFSTLHLSFIKLLRRHDVVAASYHYIPHSGFLPGDASFALISFGFPAALSDPYAEFSLHKVDPSIAVVLGGGHARWWGEIEYQKLHAQEKEFLEFAKNEVGFTGLLMPLFGPLGRNGFLALGFGRNEPHLSDALVQILHGSCLAAHLHYCDLLAQTLPKSVKLSRREREILSLVAIGHSNGAIAELLKLSEHSVVTYLRRCYGKLDVNDRVTAVLKALSIGQLSSHASP